MKKRCIFWRQNSNQTILVILSQCVLRYSVLKSRDHHDYHLCHLQVLYRDEQAFLVNFTRTKTPRITTSLDNKPPQKSSSNLERKIRKPIASSFRRRRFFFLQGKNKGELNRIFDPTHYCLKPLIDVCLLTYQT